MDDIVVASRRNTVGGFAAGDIARYQAAAFHVAPPEPPTSFWPYRRIPLALDRAAPIAVA